MTLRGTWVPGSSMSMMRTFTFGKSVRNASSVGKYDLQIGQRLPVTISSCNMRGSTEGGGVKLRGAS